MFRSIVEFSVRRWPAVLALATLFAAIALNAFRSLPVEAFPDVTDASVDVVAAFPGQSAEEVERRVTLELERVLAGTPHMTNLRSVSVFGLSLVSLRFDDRATDRENRALVGERLHEASLPDAVEAVLGPQATPVGQIFRYTLHGPRSQRDLRSLQDWVVERRLRAVSGVADVVTFGGFERQYEVRIDPVRLAGVGVSIADVFRALERANSNAGGGYVGIGSQEFVVRGLGTVRNPADIGAALVREQAGVPVRVRDVADIVEGSTPRRGSVGRGEDDEVVEGIVLLRRGENPSEVLEALRARVETLDREVLPRDVHIVPFYDRGTLIASTLDTVAHNLLHGAALVVLVLWLFLRSFRSALIVAVVIPLALLCAFLALRIMGRSANLISLGAIDFGILVDGAVVVVESVLHTLAREKTTPDRGERGRLIARASARVARSVTFAMLIIVAGLVPIFALERVEGRIFAPMAFTYVFALLGALVAATTVVPALATALLPAKIPHGEGAWLDALGRGYTWALRRLRPVRVALFVGVIVASVGMARIARGVGTEFLPELNEGGLYITAIFPSTIALDEVRDHVPEIRRRILALPEAVDVLSHIGRPEQAAQAEGPNNVEFFVALAPMDRWRRGAVRRDLEDELRRSLAEIPGVQYNFSQPITDRVYETISGIIGQVVVKIRGDDLARLAATAERVRDELATVAGVADLSIYQSGDAPQVSIELDRDRLAQHGLSVDEAQTTIEIALGGKVATSVWEGERRYGVALRLPDAVRADPDAFGRLVIGDGARRVTLAEVADVRFTRGRAAIWREDMSRFVAVKFNVRGRDLGSVVNEGRARVATALAGTRDVSIAWGGEFENQQRAMRRLAVVVPIALVVIVGVLFANFRRWRPTVSIAAILPLAALASIAGLRVCGENFSVAAAVGAIALLGQVALAGVLVCGGIETAITQGANDPVVEGARDAMRPVLLTTALAVLGLVPAAFSNGMGSETQRPFAIAIIAGLMAALPLVLFVLPLVVHPSRPRSTPVLSRPVIIAMLLAAISLFASRDASAQGTGAMREADLLRTWLRSGREHAVLRTQIGAARFDVVTASLLPNPEIAVGASALTVGVPPDGRVNFTAQVSMPIPLAGQIAARRVAALRAVDVAEASVAVSVWQRASEIHALAIDRAFADARVAMLTDNASELSDLERVIRSRASEGVALAYDAMRLATTIATVQADISASMLDRDRAEALLVAAIASRDVANAPVTRSTLVTLRDGIDDASVVCEALARRPDLQVARRSAIAFDAMAGRYRREAIPTPTVWLGTLVTVGDASASVLGGVSTQLPVFDRNQGAIGRATAEAEGQRMHSALTEERIRIEVLAALHRRAAARTALDRFRDGALGNTTDLRDRARRAYQAGAFTIAELLDAYRATWDARSQALTLERALADADADAMRASMGLSWVDAPAARCR